MTPLVLIPGMMCDARMWGGFSAPPCEVIHLLPTGHGSMAALATAALRQAPPRFALAGLSMGGIVAMEMLAQAPQRIERLALLDTNPRAETAEAKARRGPQMAKALAGGLDAVLRDEMKPNYLAPGPRKKNILDLCMDMAMALGPEVFVRQSTALRDRADQCATLAGFKGPALVLMGEHDQLCPRDRHEQMHALMPQARFVVVPGAAHLPTLEAPEVTAAHLRQWLAAAA
ncbi:MAG: alpha/beta fold hydrolase [Alphaproteobacteria bacterium]|nr:alpha/beta fold hydrolase [Alphaproteobacteria bacterium]